MTILPSVLSQLSNFLRHFSSPTGSCLRDSHVISALPLLMSVKSLQPIFKATTLHARAMFITGAPLMPLPPSFGILTVGQKLCIYYVLVFKSLQSWASLQLFRKTFVVLSTYPGIIRQQICLAMSFIGSRWR